MALGSCRAEVGGINIPQMNLAPEVAFNNDRVAAAAAADYESAGKRLFMCEHAGAKQEADCSATGEKMEGQWEAGRKRPDCRSERVTCQKAAAGTARRLPMTFSDAR